MFLITIVQGLDSMGYNKVLREVRVGAPFLEKGATRIKKITSSAESEI